ncbi:MAG: DUF3429 domain-containing protein [Pseudomonadota bacterium]
MSDPAVPTAIPRAASVLGFAGLIPFVLPTVALWLLPPAYAPFLHNALIGYGLAIASFMGGVQWGLGIVKAGDPRRMARVLGQSVVPPLIAWFGVLGPFPWQYPALILAFLLVVWVDLRLVREDLAPGWYPLLRIPLTACVVVSLAGAMIHAFVFA